MAGVVADAGCSVVLMHMLGEPKTMQMDPRYDDVVREVRDFLAARAEHAVAAGVEEDERYPGSRHRVRQDGGAQPEALE